MTSVHTRRVHDHLHGPGEAEGYVVLVDRLWPRGVKKEALPHDLWAKEVAPSNELRQWFHGLSAAEQAERFDQFVERYRAELSGESADALDELVEQLRGKDTVTLLFGLRDVEHNHAKILAQRLRSRLR
ncbi:DUF488 domain-containing protein [Ornithinimicrobium avium]|uniref:DUF488 family protein n=1 Tax=Ornithinimicrobium avium TaxID=2283195 RepID=A0A345NM23_9MICO|nr:DUF488 family protein [Ornithinimicrobium avium]AXH96081.1 DUF488 family protein [Ornithinimicrobium avium]